MSRFWLQKHEGIRRLGGQLSQGFESAGNDLARDMEAHRPPLSGLRHYLGHLEGHHSVEDQHYFPLFKRTEPAVAPGFESLQADHVRVDCGMRDIVERWTIIRRLWTSKQPQGSEISAWHEIIAGFIGQVDRHMDDEKDLIVPVLPKHGAAGFN